MIDKAFLARAIDQGRGAEPADLVVKNVGLLDIVTGGVTVTDIAICGDRIVGTYEAYRGVARDRRTRAVRRARLHRHPSPRRNRRWCTPLEFDRCVLPHGVTTAICDPHEIANVLGARGHPLLPRLSAETTIMDLRVQLSSCVPATAFETSGARAAGRRPPAASRPPEGHRPRRVHELSRACSPSDADVLDKLVAFQDGHIDGHAPLRPRLRPQRLSRRRHPHRPRDDDRRGRRARSSRRA